MQYREPPTSSRDQWNFIAALQELWYNKQTVLKSFTLPYNSFYRQQIEQL